MPVKNRANVRADGVHIGKEWVPDIVLRKREYKYRKGWVILDRLVDIILANVEGCIVEIGMGTSTSILAECAEDAGVKLYGCDLRQKVEPLFGNHIIFYGPSLEFIKVFDDIPALVFLDGDHRYETVKAEFEFFFEKLTDNGVIFLHDTLPGQNREDLLVDIGCADSYKLRRELENRADEMDCFTWPWTALGVGLTMVRKKETSKDYWRQ